MNKRDTSFCGSHVAPERRTVTAPVGHRPPAPPSTPSDSFRPSAGSLELSDPWPLVRQVGGLEQRLVITPHVPSYPRTQVATYPRYVPRPDIASVCRPTHARARSRPRYQKAPLPTSALRALDGGCVTSNEASRHPPLLRHMFRSDPSRPSRHRRRPHTVRTYGVRLQ